MFGSAGHGPARFGPGGLVLMLLTWHDRARQRYQLAQLDEAALKDLGLSRVDVARECRKPFWQA